MKKKQKNYKAGQIVTIDHKRYRLVKQPKDANVCWNCDFTYFLFEENPCEWCIKNLQSNLIPTLL